MKYIFQLVKKRKRLLVNLFIFCGFFAIAYSFLDPDFLWHVRFGSEILKVSFQYTDQYSYTMPSFQFVDHAWGISVIFAFIYNNLHLGYVGVALFCALLGTIGVSIAANEIVWLIPLVAESYLYGFGVRSHISTFILLVLTIKIIQKYKQGKKNLLYGIPLTLFIWANVHGGFIIGLIYIWGFFVFDTLFLAKKTALSPSRQFLVFLLSTLLTVVTPYGIGTWVEALRTIGNPLLTKYISEWQPLSVLASFGFFMILCLFSFSLWYKKRISWLELFTLLLLIDSILSVRMVTLFCASASYAIADTYSQFIRNKKSSIDIQRLRVVTNVFIILTIIIFTVSFSIGLRARLLVSSNIYPTHAVEYLQKNGYQGNIFSIIHWNNYMLSHMPEHKTFIDGRMMVWNQTKKSGELDSAFQTYLDVTLGKTLIPSLLEEYCVSTVLWVNHDFHDGWVKGIAPINITDQLDKNIWKEVYLDYNSVIFERPLPKSCKSS